MTPEFYTAAGMGVLSWFTRARISTVPHRVSEAGILASVAVIIWALGFPEMMPPALTLLLFFVAALCIGGGIHLWQAKGVKDTPVKGGAMSGNESGKPPAGASGNFSIGQQGGTVNQTYINQAPGRLAFDEALAAELLKTIPKGKLTVEAIGSQLDLAVVQQITVFLEKQGYEIVLNWTMNKAPPPVRALEWHPQARLLIVAPSVH